MVAAFWNMVSAYTNIAALGEFTGGGGDGDREEESRIVERIGKHIVKSKLQGKDVGDIAAWEVRLWTRDKDDGWFALMHEGYVFFSNASHRSISYLYISFKRYPSIVRGGDFHSATISPKLSQKKPKQPIMTAVPTPRAARHMKMDREPSSEPSGSRTPSAPSSVTGTSSVTSASAVNRRLLLGDKSRAASPLVKSESVPEDMQAVAREFLQEATASSKANDKETLSIKRGIADSKEKLNESRANLANTNVSFLQVEMNLKEAALKADIQLKLRAQRAQEDDACYDRAVTALSSKVMPEAVRIAAERVVTDYLKARSASSQPIPDPGEVKE